MRRLYKLPKLSILRNARKPSAQAMCDADWPCNLIAASKYSLSERPRFVHITTSERSISASRFSNGGGFLPGDLPELERERKERRGGFCANSLAARFTFHQAICSASESRIGTSWENFKKCTGDLCSLRIDESAKRSVSNT